MITPEIEINLLRVGEAQYKQERGLVERYNLGNLGCVEINFKQFNKISTYLSTDMQIDK